jgi:hypothetical protein
MNNKILVQFLRPRKVLIFAPQFKRIFAIHSLTIASFILMMDTGHFYPQKCSSSTKYTLILTRFLHYIKQSYINESHYS